MELVFRKDEADFFEDDQFAIKEKDVISAIERAIESGQMPKASNVNRIIEMLMDSSDWHKYAKAMLNNLISTTDSKAAAATFRAAKAQVEDLV